MDSSFCIRSPGLSSKALVVCKPQLDAENVQRVFFYHAFQFQILNYRCFSRSMRGNAIGLVGSSSSGKSTIISSLKRIDQYRLEEGMDLTGANYIYDWMQENHSHCGVSKADWEHLHRALIPRANHFHIHDAVGDDTPDHSSFLFKTSVNKHDRARAIATAELLRQPVQEVVARTSGKSDSIMLDRVMTHVNRGCNTVFDIVNVDNVTDHFLPRLASVKMVFVYCSFQELVGRIADRNRKAFSGEIDLSEVRAGSFPLIQYGQLIRRRMPGDHDRQVIDRISRQVVEEGFEVNFLDLIEIMKRIPKDREELGRMTSDGRLEKKKTQEKRELLKAFGFSESDPFDAVAEFVPTKHYDLLVNTGDPGLGATAIERSQTIAKGILKTIT